MADTSADKHLLEMYKLATKKEDEAYARKEALRAEIGEDAANAIDAQSKIILAKMIAGDAETQAKEEAKSAKKDNQVNCCRLF